MSNAPRETARAKVNLTLKVRGKRADGYHELESLVAFATFGDELSLTAASDTSLEIGGPLASDVDAGPDNLVLRASRLWQEVRGSAGAGAFRLIKRIPVAAGLGGGSADAAAALRLLDRCYPGRGGQPLSEIAAAVGADVPACLASRPAIMRGRGERLAFLPRFPAVSVLLVNPRVAVPTGQVFTLLDASPVAATTAEEQEPPALTSLAEVARFIEAAGNDLELPAMRIAPVIGEVREMLAETQGCLAAGMSGSGATCFGLYTSDDEALRAAEAISQARSGWWVQPSVLQAV